jgi:hypothetical protein
MSAHAMLRIEGAQWRRTDRVTHIASPPTVPELSTLANEIGLGCCCRHQRNRYHFPRE